MATRNLSFTATAAVGALTVIGTFPVGEQGGNRLCGVYIKNNGSTAFNAFQVKMSCGKGPLTNILGGAAGTVNDYNGATGITVPPAIVFRSAGAKVDPTLLGAGLDGILWLNTSGVDQVQILISAATTVIPVIMEVSLS